MAKCHGLILAGGLSTRMGTDKAALRRNHQTMLEYTESLLTGLGLDVLISGGERGLPDVIPQSGPLAGIYTVIKNRQVDALLVVPVDMPLLTPDVLKKLLLAGEGTGLATCYNDCYLPLYLPVNDVLRDYLEQVFAGNTNNGSSEKSAIKSRSVKKMLAALAGQQIPTDDPSVLSNINTPEEWQTAQKLIQSGD